MFRNYLKITFRSLKNQKGYSALNIIGLALGLACCLLIGLYVRHELSYDRHLPEADRIHRLTIEFLHEDGTTRNHFAYVAPPIAPLLEKGFPEVSLVTRFWDDNSTLIRKGEQHFDEDRIFFVEPSFIDLFSIPFLRGDAETALDAPASIVLTESKATMLFANSDPLGQSLQLDGTLDVVVTGVVPDPPAETHMHYNYLVPFEAGSNGPLDAWGNNNFATYFKLPQGYAPDTLEAKLPQLLAPHLNETARTRTRLHVQPMLDIHLYSHLDAELEPNGDITTVYLFAAIALLVLLIACFNFMNLSTARAERRAAEVGTRKAIGATKTQLITQFLGESLSLAAAALVTAVGLAVAGLPLMADLLQRELRVVDLFSPLMLGLMLGAVLLAGLVAGSYPAFVLSSFEPVKALRGERGTGSWRSHFRSTLVVAQFVISMILIVGVIVVQRQLDYVQAKRLGFNQEQLVVLPATQEIRNNFEPIQAQLTAHPGVLAATASTHVPTSRLNDTTYLTYTRADQLDSLNLHYVRIEPSFFDVYEMPIVAGRTLSAEIASDSMTAYVLNESAVQELGWDAAEAAVGQPARWWGQPGQIVGVVADAHFESLHHEIKPMLFFYVPHYRRVTVRLSPTGVAETLAFLEQQWARYRPGYPFEYAFIDDSFGRLYAAEQRLGRTFGAFSLLAILVACLGLFGLASFVAERRTKEIGVRKVLGATVPGIVLLVTRDFVLLIGLATVLAWPLAWYGMHRWIEGFAYQVDIAWWVFLLASLITLVIALLTVSYHAIRAATVDPVKSLRYE